MKMSQLRDALTRAIKKHGDCEVRFSPFAFRDECDAFAHEPHSFTHDPEVELEKSLPISGVVLGGTHDDVGKPPWLCIVAKTYRMTYWDEGEAGETPKTIVDDFLDKDPDCEHIVYSAVLDPWINPDEYEDSDIREIENEGWFSQEGEAGKGEREG